MPSSAAISTACRYTFLIPMWSKAIRSGLIAIERHLPHVHRALDQDPCVDPLVEVDAPLTQLPRLRVLLHRPSSESQVADLRHDLLVIGRRRHVVVHEDEVALRPAGSLDGVHPAPHVAEDLLVTFEGGHAAELALSDAPA